MGWVNFTRNWADYEKGFGDLDGEFWIGLKNIYELTNQQNTMKVKLWDNNGNSLNWNYLLFRLYDQNRRYAISHFTRGTGDGRDDAFGQTMNHATRFHTYDNIRNGCGYSRQSGWWYYDNDCNSNSNPNGRHQRSYICGGDWMGERLFWQTSRGYRLFTHAEMKIRAQSCTLS